MIIDHHDDHLLERCTLELASLLAATDLASRTQIAGGQLGVQLKYHRYEHHHHHH